MSSKNEQFRGVQKLDLPNKILFEIPNTYLYLVFERIFFGSILFGILFDQIFSTSNCIWYLLDQIFVFEGSIWSKILKKNSIKNSQKSLFFL